MRILRIDKDDLMNGPGLRVVVWIAGCSWKCAGCHNPDSWNYDGGEEMTIEHIEYIESLLSKDYITGITFSGGDPLSRRNREGVTELIKHLRDKFPDKSFWSYTGFTWDKLEGEEVLKYLDVLVDGPFIMSLKTGNSKWRGSDNQRLIKSRESVLANEIILYDPEIEEI